MIAEAEALLQAKGGEEKRAAGRGENKAGTQMGKEAVGQTDLPARSRWELLPDPLDRQTDKQTRGQADGSAGELASRLFRKRSLADASISEPQTVPET